MSVIVPVYNQEHCIEDCLNSILCQSYDNLQVIVVDDGSTDLTGDIIDSISKRDHRIEVYHVKNQGVSNARNYGLVRVKGEYVQFVDADDRIKKQMVKRLVNIMHMQKADMIVCNYIKHFKKMYVPNMILEMPGRYRTDKYLINTLKDPGHHYYGVVWNKLYKSNIIKENKLKFRPDITLGEDFVFNIEYWQKCKSVYVDWQYMYLYSKVGGVTLSNIKYKKLENCVSELNNRRKIFSVYNKAIKCIDIDNKYEEKIWRYWIIFFVRQKYNLKYEYSSWDISDKRYWYEMMCCDSNIKKALSIVSDRWVKAYTVKFALKTCINNKIKEKFHIN